MGGVDDDSSSTDSSKSTTATTAAKKETAKKEETKEKDSVKVGESFENDGLKVTAKKAEFGYDAGEYFTLIVNAMQIIQLANRNIQETVILLTLICLREKM